MSSVFDEANMMQALQKSLPAGEHIQAAIHAIGNDIDIIQFFKNCLYTEDGFIPAPNDAVFRLLKSKAAAFDLYLGITEHHLLLSQCEKNRWYYELDEVTGDETFPALEITSKLLLEDIGTCFLLADIQSCTIKKGWMGSFKCQITWKTGNTFKLLLPKRGGLGGGMPHHTEYREAIMARLSNCHA